MAPEPPLAVGLVMITWDAHSASSLGEVAVAIECSGEEVLRDDPEQPRLGGVWVQHVHVLKVTGKLPHLRNTCRKTL